MQEIQKLIELIDEAILDEPSDVLSDWNIINDWYDSQVDHYRNLVQNANQWMNEYQTQLRMEHWVSNLKIKYTSAWGYFIEVPKSKADLIWDSLVYKQTLVNAVRYTSTKLTNFEQEILSSQSQMAEIECVVFQEICKKVLKVEPKVRKLSRITAELDVCASFSEVAHCHNYVLPKMHNWYELELQSARHAIIETHIDEFISNDTILDNKKFIYLITWPNMWGKSTFLRQNALVIIMAHMWSYVPAKKARVPLTDKIFSRIGANDHSFLWKSTFMVEMQEVAHIMNHATKESFIIIDEVGRWTSTYDGMSIAHAILQETHNYIWAKMLFSTHYHELTRESWTLAWIENYQVEVSEEDNAIVFLHTIKKWKASKSYGLEVAKLSWLNTRILTEAKRTLQKLEQSQNTQTKLQLDNETLNQESKTDKKLTSLLKDIDINSLTPVQALIELEKVKKIFES